MRLKQGPQKTESDNVFGPVTQTAENVSAWLVARVSINDQQTPPMQTWALRQFVGLRGRSVAIQVREVGSGAAKRHPILRKFRLLVASLCISQFSICCARSTSNRHLEKTTFGRGEPVFLYFSLLNEGPDAAVVVTGDADQPFCSGVSITVSSDASPAFSCPSWKDNSCSYIGPPRKRQLASGQTYTTRFLLNYHHDLNAAGDYWVDADYHSISNGGEGEHQRLAFRIDNDSISPSEWRTWLEQLQSPELDKRQEAARTLASLAPASLEEILLGFADNPEFRPYAPLSFHRLNTNRSIEALARFMQDPATEERIEAAHYLAETNDQRWFPLLRHYAEQRAQNSAYPTYAPELGGDKMLPVLVALEKSPDTQFTRLNAIMAMASTGSRAAIPILLDLLKNPDPDANSRAEYALHLLTHRTAVDPEGQNPRADYVKWSRWWEREGATAPIYKDSECGELVQLP